MPVQTTYFNPVSFQQAAPVVSGMQAGAGISAQLGLAALQRQQAQTAAINNRFLPAATQANIDLTNARTGAIPYQNQLAQAQTGLIGAQTQNVPYQILPLLDPITQMRLSQQLAQRFNGGIPANNLGSATGGGGIAGGSAIPPITSNNGGMTIQPGQQQPPYGTPYSLSAMSGAVQPASQYTTLPGGLTEQQGQQVAQQLGAQSVQGNQSPGAAMSALGMPSTGNPFYDNLYGIRANNLLQQMGKNPAFGSKYGAGSTNINPVTGQTYTTDTVANTTRDQGTMASLARIQPILDSLSKNLAQFRTAGTQGSLLSQQLGNYILGHNNPLPNQYAQGQSDLEIAPESLLRGWGLPPTNESLERMQEAVKPRWGESGQGYQQRIANTLQQIQRNSQQSSARLKSGQDLDYNDDDIRYTAQKYGLTPDQVREKLGVM